MSEGAPVEEIDEVDRLGECLRRSCERAEAANLGLKSLITALEADDPADRPEGLRGDLGEVLDRVMGEVMDDLKAQREEIGNAFRAMGIDPDTLPEHEERVRPAPRPRGPKAAPRARKPRGGAVARDVLEVLSLAAVEGMSVRLPEGQLERKLYQAVDAVLRACGGKWTRRTKTHLFDVDPAALLGDVINTGKVALAPDLGWFPTPEALAFELVRRADVRPGMVALEPSAGRGAIALELRGVGARVWCTEIDPGRATHLRALGFAVVEGDALAGPAARRYDRVVMNPPFARQADVDHVLRAHAQLAAGGLLVSVMGGGTAFRMDRKAVEFRAFVEAHGGTIEALPDGSFKESGTGVSTVVVTIPAAASAPARVDVVEAAPPEPPAPEPPPEPAAPRVRPVQLALDWGGG